MPILRFVAAACLLVLMQAPASASPGDVFVPAHRTRDGSYVPPNVSPMSGGTYLATRPTRGASGHRPIRGAAVEAAKRQAPTSVRR